MSATAAEQVLVTCSTQMKRILTLLQENPCTSHQPASRHRYYLLQMARCLYRDGRTHWSEWTFLPSPIREALKDAFHQAPGPLEAVVPAAHWKQSRQCVKALLQLRDSQSVEAVWMQFRQSGHASLCVSSQVGCALRCQFCATGAVGFKRQMSTDEILAQVLYFRHFSPDSAPVNGLLADGADTDGDLEVVGTQLPKASDMNRVNRIRPFNHIDTISFMGMGEALQNPNVFRALQLLIHPQGFGLSPRRISVSTVGIIPGIDRLAREFPAVNVAFSLHSPFDQQRDQLVPANKTYPMSEVWRSLERHVTANRRKIFIAYLLLPCYNDSEDHASAVASQIRSLPASIRHLFHVNLLRYNPAEGVPLKVERTDAQSIERFAAVLKRHSISYTLRQSFGVDIDAACGQLYQVAVRKQWIRA